MRYTTIFLDADGTLLDFASGEKAALFETFQTLGLPWGPDTAATYRRVNQKYWDLLEQKRISREELARERFAELISVLGIAQIGPEALNAAYMDALSRQGQLLDGAAELASALAPGRTLAIVTNGMQKTQKGRFAASGLGEWIPHLFISEEVGFVKPDPRFFERVLDALGQPDKAEILLMGDSLTADIAGGLACGIDTCWFNPKGKENNTPYRPRYEIAALGQLLEIV